MKNNRYYLKPVTCNLKPKTLLALMMALLLLLPIGKAWGQTVTIGTGTTTQYVVPYNNYYHYGTTQILYTASEINGSNGNGPKSITKIAFNVSNSTSYTPSVRKIYMKQTTQTSLTTSNYISSGATLVYDNPASFGSATGWEIVTLSTPFSYDGTSNLIVIFENANTTYTNSLKYNSTSISDRCIYRQNDNTSSYGDYTNTSNSYTTYSNRPNTQITYTIPTYSLTVNRNPTAGGSVSPTSGTYQQGVTASITATPATGYRFSSWSVSGTGATLSSTTANPTTFTMGTANATVTANFTAIPSHTLTVSANPTAGGTVTGSGTYYEGQTQSITATPASGYRFSGWTVSGTGASVANANSASTTFTMGTANATVTANFTRIYTLTVNAATGGSASGGGGSYAQGETHGF